MMAVFGACVAAFGGWLIARPQAWWRVTERPARSRQPQPGVLRGLRLRGVVCLVGGVALVVLRFVR